MASVRVWLLFGLFGHRIVAQVRHRETSSFPPLPVTSFTCHGRAPGYYADVENGCKTYHICDGSGHFTYLCPKRTLFQQRSRICDHEYLVECEESPRYYETQHDNVDEDEDFLGGPTESEDTLPNQDNFKNILGTEYIYNYTEHMEDFTEEQTSILNTEEPSESPTTLFEPLTEKPSTSLEPLTENSTPWLNEDYSSQTLEKPLKILLKDFRSLFFIPEYENNSIVAEPKEEFVFPAEKIMKFKSLQKIVGSHSLCPAYCNPKFFLPGTCHPCIMIK